MTSCLMAPPPLWHAGDVTLSDLLVRAGTGDRDAFAGVYDATCASVHRLALCVVGRPETAEEATRRTYLEVWRSACRFDPSRERALSWVLTVAHRRAVELRD